MSDATAPFARTAQVGWGDLDANGHLRNTAYLDMSADTRMIYFASRGFPIATFAELQIGPVVRGDQLEYFRESRLLESLRITLLAAGLSADGARFRLCNEFWREDGRLAARVSSEGGWLDLRQRRLTTPPEDLRQVLAELQHTEAFEVLPDLNP
ncbi:MAG: thioesterase family protein [Xanthomonadales bacterium]|nr:thioesterase family protein [Xanthomonadales bacterium]MCB1635737.1 thioesterase family protein [Xanthomonadales bacterium]MCB1643069.1 thioesterase family protein [Xanthomonadales bacterium]